MRSKKAVLAFVFLFLPFRLFSQTEVKSAELRGTVTDGNGAAIRGASIFIHRNVGIWGDKIEFGGESDGNGRFVLHLPLGAYDIFVTAYPFSAQSRTVLVKAGGSLELRWKLPLAPDMCDFPGMNCDPVERVIELHGETVGGKVPPPE